MVYHSSSLPSLTQPSCALPHPPCRAAPVLLRGSNICGDKDLVLCRQQGRHLATELLSTGARPSGSSSGSKAGSPVPNSTCTSLLPALPPANRLLGVASSSDGCCQVHQEQLQPGAEQEWLLVKPLGMLPGKLPPLL